MDRSDTERERARARVTERDTETTIADATGMERPDDEPAMAPAKELTDAEAEATGGEKTLTEGMSGVAATHRAFGGGAVNAAGGIGTHVPADEDEHVTRGDESEDPGGSSDPRGY
jgi:hypothetical protein